MTIRHSCLNFGASCLSGEDEFTLYEDDKHNFDYWDGAWSTTQYRVTVDGDTATVRKQAWQGNWTPPARSV